MPWKPKTHAPVARSRLQGKRPRGPDDRPSSNARGYDGRWQKARKLFLQDNPICVECKKAGHIEPAKVVDHIIPHKGDQERFWDEANWQALCAACHNRKTARGQ